MFIGKKFLRCNEKIVTSATKIYKINLKKMLQKTNLLFL